MIGLPIFRSRVLLLWGTNTFFKEFSSVDLVY
jgi:hypothetical protein